MYEDLISEIRNDYSKYTISLPNSDLPLFLKKIKERLEERIIGQPRPIQRIMRGITTFYAKLNDPNRPIGVFLFAGPSGSGKTLTAEELAYALIGEPENGLSPLVKIDCGSLSLSHTVASLTGSPPGYVGYGESVSLEMVGKYDKKKKDLDKINKRIDQWLKGAIERIYQRFGDEGIETYISELQEIVKRVQKEIDGLYGPFRSVVLFDEIEKANKNIQSQLLRILDEGKLDLLNGRTVDFRGSIIILTTNVGTEQILAEHLSEEKIGFSLPYKERIGKAQTLNEKINRRVRKEIFDRRKAYFKPELLGRIGEPGIIVFNVLSYGDYQKILEIRLRECQDQLMGDNGPGALLLSYTQNFKDFLIEKGISPIYGARALRSVIDKYVRVPISEKILAGQLKAGDKILLDVKYKEEVGWTKIIRQKRPRGIALPDFEKREIEKVLPSDIAKILDRFFEDFLSEKIGPRDSTKN